MMHRMNDKKIAASCIKWYQNQLSSQFEYEVAVQLTFGQLVENTCCIK